MRNLAITLIFVVSSVLIYAQTNVSGGIFSNTTWALSGSPYIVTGDVVVLGGVTLTIQPGVTVKFDSNTDIQNRGNLYADGTVSDSIIFTSNSTSPYAGIYYGIDNGSILGNSESYKYCKFSYADTALGLGRLGIQVSHCLFISNVNGLFLFQAMVLDSCVFKYDTSAILADSYNQTFTGCEFYQNGTCISSGGAYDTVANCIFSYNGNAIHVLENSTIKHCTFEYNSYGVYGALKGLIENCKIEYNNVGINSDNNGNNIITSNYIADNSIGIETYNDAISCNTFCNNTGYNIKAEMATNESAQYNYWCLNDSAAIQATIYDAYQDLSLGLIIFTPFDTMACAGVPNAVKELTINAGAINIYPNPSQGSFHAFLSF